MTLGRARDRMPEWLRVSNTRGEPRQLGQPSQQTNAIPGNAKTKFVPKKALQKMANIAMICAAIPNTLSVVGICVVRMLRVK